MRFDDYDDYNSESEVPPTDDFYYNMVNGKCPYEAGDISSAICVPQ